MRISDWSSDVCSSDLVTAFLRRMIAHPAFVAGDVHTGFLDANPQIAAEPELSEAALQALLAAAALSTRPMLDIADAVPDLHAAIGAWRNWTCPMPSNSATPNTTAPYRALPRHTPSTSAQPV